MQLTRVREAVSNDQSMRREEDAAEETDIMEKLGMLHAFFLSSGGLKLTSSHRDKGRSKETHATG